MNKKNTVLCALFVMLLWGSLFPIVKLGYKVYDVLNIADIMLFAGVRFTVCGIIICIFSAIKNPKSFCALKQTWGAVMRIGLYAIILHYGFTYMGLRITESSKTAVLKQAGTLFYICFSPLFFKDDRLTMKKLIGVLLGFSGIIAIDLNAEGFSFNIGNACIIAASFCTVFSNVLSKKTFSKIEPVTATGISQLFGGAVLLLCGKAGGGSIHFAPDMDIWIMIYMCIASTVSYCLWFTIVQKGELSKLFIIKFAEPVFAAIFSALLLKENIFNLNYLAASILIGTGIIISNLQPKKEQLCFKTQTF